jgi:hypothetical protein
LLLRIIHHRRKPHPCTLIALVHLDNTHESLTSGLTLSSFGSGYPLLQELIGVHGIISVQTIKRFPRLLQKKPHQTSCSPDAAKQPEN